MLSKDLTDKERVKRQFGAHAALYTSSTVHSQGPSLARMVELAQPEGDWLVLDVSTGAGHTALAFSAHVHRVIATDLTEPMVVQALHLAAERAGTNLRFTIADAEKLPFGDASFDLVTNRLALHHYPNPRAAINETAQVLKPAGIFALVDNLTPPDKVTAGYINHFEKMRDPSHNWCYPLVRLEVMFADAGLAVTHAETFAKEMDLENWARRLGHDDPMIAQLAKRLTDAPEAVKEFLKPHETEGKMKFVLTEAIVVGQKAK